MALLVIKNKATIAGINDTQKSIIKSRLTIPNPKYIQVANLGKSVFGVDKEIYFYEDHPDSLDMPVGFVPELLEFLPLQPKDLVDGRFKGPPIVDWKFKGKLLPYQENPVTTMMDKTIGVVQAPTGSGKTVMIVAYVIRRKQPTLVMVNTIELANQMIKNFVKFTNKKEDDIGFIGSGIWKVRGVTITILQTMARLSKTEFRFLNNSFGQVIVDEVHIIPAVTFYNVITKLDAKYKFGLSATPQRDDGLTNVIHWATGPKICELSLKDVKDRIIIPTIRTVNTEYYFPLWNSDEYAAMIDDLIDDGQRNKLILETIDEYKGKQMIVLTTRVKHATFLANQLNKRGHKAEYLVSRLPHPTKKGKFKAMPKKQRAAVIDNLNSNKTKIVVSTFSLFSTGIDILGLEVLFLAGPTRSEIKLKQSIGRIMRKASIKKTPEIVDFRDMCIDLLKRQAYARNKIYKYIKNVDI
jgi:superfamily II DNA or RNA helicase